MSWLRSALLPGVIVFLYALPLLHIPVLDADEADFASILFYPVGIYVLLAIGLYVAVGKAGLLNLAHIAFFAIGAYTMGVLNTAFGVSYFMALPVATIVAILFGLLLAIPTLRLRGDYLAVATIGFAQVVQIVLTNANVFGGVRGISNIAPPPSLGPLIFGVLDPVPYDWLVLTSILLCYAAVRRLEATHVGRAWSALRGDEDVAELMGVPTFRYKVLALVLSAGIAGMAGATYATKVSFISPETFDVSLAILLLAALVLGGTGHLFGAVLGTALIAYLPERFRAFGDFRILLFAGVLVLVMIYRPQGLASLFQFAARRPPPGLARRGGSTQRAQSPAPEPPRSDAAATELEISAVAVRFGGVSALDGVTLHVAEGEILGVIGPNGAGKTTLFNILTGVFQPSAGQMRFGGTSVLGLRPHRITTLGIVRTFQNIRIFEDQTVRDNVLLGADCGRIDGPLVALLGLPSNRRAERAAQSRASEALAFAGLEARAEDLAGTLSYGEQRRLEIARAFATRPRLMLLDEPAAGSNPTEKQELAALIRQLRVVGCAVLLIEHDMDLVMELCDRVVVLEFGRRIAEGLPRTVQSDPRVIQAYLGNANVA